MRVNDILKTKGSKVNIISPDESAHAALKSIVENRVGSLVVVDKDDSPVGIITERDLIRLIHQKQQSDWQNLPIREVMTKDMIIAFPEDDVEYVMKLMTVNRFRHMPILKDKKLAGLISIGDIIKSLLTDIKAENRHLSDYISGKYPA